MIIDYNLKLREAAAVMMTLVQVLLPPDLAPGSRQLVHLTARPMVRGGGEVTQYLNNIYTLTIQYLHNT